jgi:hypothetical protein
MEKKLFLEALLIHQEINELKLELELWNESTGFTNGMAYLDRRLNGRSVVPMQAKFTNKIFDEIKLLTINILNNRINNLEEKFKKI